MLQKNLQSLFILFILILVSTELFSQSSSRYELSRLDSLSNKKTNLSFTVGPSFLIHLRDQDAENELIPDQYESLEERPTIASFYNNGIGLNAEIQASIYSSIFETTYLIGFSYEYQHLEENNEFNVDELLGEILHLHIMYPYFGIAYGDETNPMNSFVKMGPSFRKYYGNASISGYEIKQNYDISPGFRVSGGIYSEVFSQKIPFYYNLELGIDLGTVIREDVDIYKNGRKIAKAEITGAESMRDYLISISFSIGYKF